MLDRTNPGCVQDCWILKIVFEDDIYSKFNDKGFFFKMALKKYIFMQFTLFVKQQTTLTLPVDMTRILGQCQSRVWQIQSPCVWLNKGTNQWITIFCLSIQNRNRVQWNLDDVEHRMANLLSLHTWRDNRCEIQICKVEGSHV